MKQKMDINHFYLVFFKILKIYNYEVMINDIGDINNIDDV